jgi:hypothetical protein
MYIMYWELHLDCPVLLFIMLTGSNNQFKNFKLVQVFFNKNKLIGQKIRENAGFVVSELVVGSGDTWKN